MSKDQVHFSSLSSGFNVCIQILCRSNLDFGNFSPIIQHVPLSTYFHLLTFPNIPIETRVWEQKKKVCKISVQCYILLTLYLQMIKANSKLYAVRKHSVVVAKCAITIFQNHFQNKTYFKVKWNYFIMSKDISEQ